MRRPDQIIWWGGWPWKWNFYYRHRSKYGALRLLMVGPVEFVWSLA